MIYETYDRYGDGSVVLTCYILDDSSPFLENCKRDAVVICPGGGYSFVSIREKEPVALAYANAGYHSFTLVYSVDDKPLELKPVQDLSWAMSVIRKNADKWNLNPDHIAVCGFSAGGHLTATLGTIWDKKEVYEPIDLNFADNKPNALILGYPVITANEFAHKGSITMLLSDNDDDILFNLLSPDKNVGVHTPPTFLWHTYSDKTVPVENSIIFSSALRQHNIPFELHIFSDGNHGYSLANDFTQTEGCPPNFHIAKWFDLSLEWLKTIFK